MDEESFLQREMRKVRCTARCRPHWVRSAEFATNSSLSSHRSGYVFAAYGGIYENFPQAQVIGN
jgi:drug/metabolite transporter superfamily protein YnfA